MLQPRNHFQGTPSYLFKIKSSRKITPLTSSLSERLGVYFSRHLATGCKTISYLKVCVSSLFCWVKSISKHKWPLQALKNTFCLFILAELGSDCFLTSLTYCNTSERNFPCWLHFVQNNSVLSSCFCPLCLIEFYSLFSTQSDKIKSLL